MVDTGFHVVTGGAGFIGSAFIGKLNSHGIDNIIVVDSLGHSEKWKNLRGKFFVDYLHKDQFLSSLLAGQLNNRVRSITHMGACSSTTETNVEYLMQNNFRYSRELADYALKHNIRFIYASSAATYGDGSLGYSDDDSNSMRLLPLNSYGFSKQAFDLWAIRSGASQRIAGLKFFNVFGPNEYHKGSQRSVAFHAYQQIKQTGSASLFKSYNPQYNNGEQKRDFVYIKDCLNVMWALLNNTKLNGIYNLGSGQAHTWNDLVKAIFSALNLTPNIQYVDMPLQLQTQYQYYTQADMSKLRAALNEPPSTALESAVRDYVLNYLESGNATI